MVKSLFLTGIGVCGKTILSYGLITKFKQEGIKTTYFKPVTVVRKRILIEEEVSVDSDVLTMKEALGLPEPFDVISPCALPEKYVDTEVLGKKAEFESQIREAFKKISSNKDLVIVEGHKSPDALFSVGLSDPQVAKILGSKMLLVTVYDDELAIDQLLAHKHFIEMHNVELIGVILNNVPLEMVKRAEETVAQFLNQKGLKVLGVIPQRAELTAPTVREIAGTLEAEILEGEEYLDNVVEDILCGAMSPEAALRWFRRTVNCLIVTGGDRTDLILTALETKPSAIVLTGNLYPTVKVLTMAREKKVPVLLVPYDTYTTVELLRKAQSVVTAETLKKKHSMIEQAISEHVSWREILKNVLG